MSDVGLQEVFRAAVVSRLTYASTAWSGFVTTVDIQRVHAFLCHSKRCGFCPPGLLEFGEPLADWNTTTEFSVKSAATTHITFYIAFCRRHLSPLRTMNCAPVGMTRQLPAMLLILWTVN